MSGWLGREPIERERGEIYRGKGRERFFFFMVERDIRWPELRMVFREERR
jgi:hypothetical protein